MNKYSSILNPSIVRNNIEKNGYVELTIGFTLSTIIPKDGKVQIYFSKDQIKLTAG